MLAAISVVSSSAQELNGDVFKCIDQNARTFEVTAELVGSGQSVHALRRSDGQFVLIPEAAVQSREPGDDGVPISHQDMLDGITEQFGVDRFRGQIEEPFVIGLILAAPLDRKHEARTRAFLKKVGRFLRSVEHQFTDFARRMNLEVHEAEFPLPVLVFESDRDFNDYTRRILAGRGLSAVNIAGFYNQQTNWLTIRLGECSSFATPLHEAIHQQVYNRGLFQRFAPVPKWFDEGIATGFEGDGDRIDIGPLRINSRYARLARQSTQVTWSDVIARDTAFTGDVLAGDAYIHAWSIHWMLVSEYRREYSEYVRSLSALKTLQESSRTDRVQDFEAAFGKPVASIQEEFQQTLTTGIRRQKIDLSPQPEKTQQRELAEVTMHVVTTGGAMRAEGLLKNISPIRPMSFHVTVATPSGMYADWHVPNLDAGRSFSLARQAVRKVAPGGLPGGLPGGAATYTLYVNSAVPESDEAQNWVRGNFPVPSFPQ